ncbi:50S ribosomal protein L19 [Microgenomates group bacterium RBG_16_45_19]|nr:MAG: 50S ribosomal protein L19 [Microgenomates group bacterium RBG_16_45_19]
MANSFTHQTHAYHVGDHVAVYQKIEEEGKLRTQVFDGVIIAIKGRGAGQTFTVRKIAAGNIGVERIIPVHSPRLDKLVIKSHGSVRRAKLYYLRSRSGRLALRVKEKKTTTTPPKSKSKA